MYSPLGLFHTACGAIALLLGAVILLRTKGTVAHARTGWAYVVAMLCLNVSAFGIYNLTGGFNLFHVLAAISLATLGVGLAQVMGRRRWRNWLWRHYQYMVWSYVGLLAATCNEAFVRVPALQQLTAMTTAQLPLLVMAILVAACGALIFALQRRTLARYRDYGCAATHS
jgi:uncharacterized membrane protein